LKKISPPSASKIISVAASIVIVELEVMVAAVRVVIIADVCVPLITPAKVGFCNEITDAEAVIPVEILSHHLVQY